MLLESISNRHARTDARRRKIFGLLGSSLTLGTGPAMSGMDMRPKPASSQRRARQTATIKQTSSLVRTSSLCESYAKCVRATRNRVRPACGSPDGPRQSERAAHNMRIVYRELSGTLQDRAETG